MDLEATVFRVRAEGNRHIIFEYVGSDPTMSKRLLRIRKIHSANHVISVADESEISRLFIAKCFGMEFTSETVQMAIID